MREYFRNARVIYNEARRALDLNERGESSLVTQFQRLALASLQLGIHGFERAHLPPIARAIDRRSGHHSPPAGIRGASRHPPGRGNRAPRGASLLKLSPLIASAPSRCGRRSHSILSLPHAAAALRVMHDTGLLQAMFPEWRNIFCLVVPDFYHRYTVDEHTLVAIEKLAELAASKDPAAAPPGRNSLRGRGPGPAPLRAAVSRLRQRRPQRRPRASLGRAGSHRDAAHPNAARRTERRRISDRASPGSVRRDEFPRSPRSRHRSLAGRSHWNLGAAEAADASDLRRHLRRESRRDDSLAAGTALGDLPRHSSTIAQGTRNRTHRRSSRRASERLWSLRRPILSAVFRRAIFALTLPTTSARTPSFTN